MSQAILHVIINILLISWPILYFMIWHALGYLFIKRQIRLHTLFYVSRDQLWKMIYREIYYMIGIPMSIANAAVYAALYYHANGITRIGDNLLVIYLFVFGCIFNYLYTSLVLSKHCFTREKSAGFKLVQILRIFLIAFQFIILDGYVLMNDRMRENMPLTKWMSKFGLFGFIVEIFILILMIITAMLIIKMAKKLFYRRNFPR